MNKKYQKFIPLLIIVSSAILFFAIFCKIVSPVWEDYKSKTQEKNNILKENQSLEERYEKEKAESEQQKLKLQSIKQIYESNINGENDNLSVYGTMFDEIIKKAQANGLAIRSIEYDTKPQTNPVYANFSNNYNVCELKFFFVGTYSQLMTFLNDLNNNFQYLISISDLNVTAFTGNTDYLLINISIVLYSKRVAEVQKETVRTSAI